MIVTLIFNIRIRKEPTIESSRADATWQKFLVVLYCSSLLIFIRSLFRMIEYLLGHDSVLQSSEIYIYIFDALLMAAVAVIFNIFHPSRYMTLPRRLFDDQSCEEAELGTYDTVPNPPAYNGAYAR